MRQSAGESGLISAVHTQKKSSFKVGCGKGTCSTGTASSTGAWGSTAAAASVLSWRWGHFAQCEVARALMQASAAPTAGQP